MNRPTLWDGFAAVGAGAVLAASPLTGVDLGPKVVVGAVVAGAVLAYRLRGAPEADAGAAEQTKGSWRLPPLVWPALILYVGVFFPTFQWLYEKWTLSLWANNHGIFIPFVSGYLTWAALRDDEGDAEDGSPWGFAWVGVGLLLAVADAGVRTHYLALFGFLLTLPGLALLTLGPRRTRMLAVPIALMLLTVPIPVSFASDLYLRRLTATAVEPLIQLLGYPAYREATVILMPSNTFVVANACSGFSTLYASLAVAVILACYAKTHARRVLLLLAAFPLAILANVGRVLALIIGTHGLGNWVIESPLHAGTGVAAFVVVLVGLFALSDQKLAARAPA